MDVATRGVPCGKDVASRCLRRFPRRLHAAILARGYRTLKDASAVLGPTRPQLSLYCSGKRRPTVGVAIALAVGLDVSLEWLMGLDVLPDGTPAPVRDGRLPVRPGRVAWDGGHDEAMMRATPQYGSVRTCNATGGALGREP